MLFFTGSALLLILVLLLIAGSTKLTGINDLAVIKYNWQDGLVADKPRTGLGKPCLELGKPAEIFPYHAGPGIRLIGVYPHEQKHIVIRYKQ